MPSETNSGSNNSNLKFIDINGIESDSNSIDDSNSSLDLANIPRANVIKNKDPARQRGLSQISEYPNNQNNTAKLRKLTERKEKLSIINKLLKNFEPLVVPDSDTPLTSMEYELIRMLVEYKYPNMQDLIFINDSTTKSSDPHHSQFSVLPVAFTDLLARILSKFTPFLTVSKTFIERDCLLRFKISFFDNFSFEFSLKSSNDLQLDSLVLTDKLFVSHVGESELLYVLNYYFPKASNEMPLAYDFTDLFQKLNFYSLLHMKRIFYLLLLACHYKSFVNKLQWVSIVSKIKSFIPYTKSLKNSLDILGDYLRTMDADAELSFEQNCQTFEILPMEKKTPNEEKYTTFKSMGLLFPNLTELKLEGKDGFCLDLTWLISFENVDILKINEPRSIITSVVYNNNDEGGVSFIEKDDKIIEQLIKRYGVFKGLKSYIDTVFDI